MEPILFIHGFGGYNEQYQPIMKYLMERGFTQFYEFNYDKKFGFVSIKVIAQELAEFINKNVKEETINIIGFSQGGIIALAYLKYFKNLPACRHGREVNKLFTICTPHKGSRLAKIMNLPGLIDLRPKSNLLEELETFIKDTKINIYSVYTPFDLMVFPGWNARSEFGKQKIVFAPTHPSAFSWPATLKFIYNNLVESEKYPNA